MISIEKIALYVAESAALVTAIYLVTKKGKFDKLFIMMVITIALIFILLDHFSPMTSAGVRQGSGFMVGYSQFGGDTMPNKYYGDHRIDTPSANGMENIIDKIFKSPLMVGENKIGGLDPKDKLAGL